MHAKFPDQDPAIAGVLLLHDLLTGALLAVMDSTYITALRTGIGAALATNLLARKQAGRVAIVGAGTQAMFQLRYLSLLRDIERVTVYDINLEQAQTYSKCMGQELGISIIPCATLGDAIADVDIILTATWSIEPFLFLHHIKPGTHITTIGADQPGEAELGPDLIKQSIFVCDDRDLAVEMGAIGGTGLNKMWIDAELGEIVGGKHPGRTNEEQITVYGAVGVAFQDLVTAWQIYQAAQLKRIGQCIDFLA